MKQREKLHKAFSGLGLDTKGLKTSLSIIDQDILKTLLEQRVMTPKELRALKQKAADERAEAKHKVGGVLKEQVNNERQTLQAMGGFLKALVGASRSFGGSLQSAGLPKKLENCEFFL